jgi:hypothetical protein
MATRIGMALRIAVLGALALLIAACAPVEAPRLGSGPPVLSPKTLKTLSKPTPTAAAVTFALEPITNAPGEMVYGFEDALKKDAPSRQLKIVDVNDPAAEYRLKIYLSAVGDYSGSLMIYVADVFDATGGRVHRISGQIKTGGSTADPWAPIKATGILAQAAQETIDALGDWVHS